MKQAKPRDEWLRPDAAVSGMSESVKSMLFFDPASGNSGQGPHNGLRALYGCEMAL